MDVVLSNNNGIKETYKIHVYENDILIQHFHLIKNNFDCLVVVGIGGSFLGSYSFDQIFKNSVKDDSFEILYAGITALIESIKVIITPKDVNYSSFTASVHTGR